MNIVNLDKIKNKNFRETVAKAYSRLTWIRSIDIVDSDIKFMK